MKLTKNRRSRLCNIRFGMVHQQLLLKVIVSLMIRTKNSNSWSIPSGGVEVGETAEEA